MIAVEVSNRFLGAFAKLRKAIFRFVMSVRPSAWKNSASSGWILMALDIELIFFKIVEKIHILRITGTLHEDVSTFMTISR